MLSVNIRFNTTKAINGLEKSVDQLVGLISQDLFKTIKRKTPKKTGRARQGWNLKKQGKGFDVKNTVPYIQRLDEGYSKQAPKGFSRQSIREVINRNKNRRIK